MQKIKDFKQIFLITAALIFAALLLIKQDIGIKGLREGMGVCINIIIPSLFSYTFAVLFLLRLNVETLFSPIEKIAIRIFNMDKTLFSVFFLSFLGGYPCGAKLISELCFKKRIEESTAENMLMFCVNAGPGFIILAIGNRIFGSSVCGSILLASHIFSSMLLAFLLKRKNKITAISENKSIKISEAFMSSVTDSADAVFKICIYIMFFAVITAYINSFEDFFKYIKYFSYIIEVTNGAKQSKNIYIISFLLGFSGLSVWCQVLSIAKGIKIKIGKFALIRTVSGILNTLFTHILVIVFKPSINTNSADLIFSNSDNTLYTTVALLLMLLLLFFSIENKISCRKIKNDLL